jgi:hypothetical protein
MKMKLTRMFCFLIILGASAVAANAQTPVDPIARINGIGDPACGGAILCITDYMPNAFGTLNGSAVLSVPYSPDLDVEFSFDDPAHDINPAAILSELFLQYTDVPALTSFECESDIWASCAQSDLGGGVTQFALTGSGLCVDDATLYTCPGFMSAQEGATATNTPLVSPVPEPGSMALFGTGLILLFVGTRRRIQARA